MKTIRLPVNSTSLSTRIYALRNDIRARLKKFCIDKVVEHKLAPRSFSFEFDLEGQRDGGQKKSIQKLQGLLEKSLLKQMPYLAYAKSGQFLKYASNNRLVTKLYLPAPIPVRVSASNDMQSSFENSPKIRALKKYFKRINHALREQGQCLGVAANFSYEIPKSESMKYANARESNTEKVVFVTGVVNIDFQIGIWTHRTWLDRREDSSVSRFNGQHGWIEHIKANRNSEANRRALSSDTYWRLYSIREIVSLKHLLGYYMSTEKMFLILNEMQQVLKTLSRVTTYDPSAFNIGSPEAS